MICDHCQVDYPQDLVQPFNLNGKYTNSCSICALERIRKAHGVKSYEFSVNSMARKLYDKALKFKAELLLKSLEK